MLCSHPRGYEETLVGRDGAIFHSGAASLLILLFHATLSKKVTVNRFPRSSQWAIACFLLPLIFQGRGIKCVTHRPLQSNACLLHALLTWRGKSHDAFAKKKKKTCGNPNNDRCLDWPVQPIGEDSSAAALDQGGGVGDREPRGKEMTASCVVGVMVAGVCVLAEAARRSRQQRWDGQLSLA